MTSAAQVYLDNYGSSHSAAVEAVYQAGLRDGIIIGRSEVPLTPVPVPEVPLTPVPVPEVPLTPVPVLEVPLTPVPVPEVPTV